MMTHIKVLSDCISRVYNGGTGEDEGKESRLIRTASHFPGVVRVEQGCGVSQYPVTVFRKELQ